MEAKNQSPGEVPWQGIAGLEASPAQPQEAADQIPPSRKKPQWCPAGESMQEKKWSQTEQRAFNPWRTVEEKLGRDILELSLMMSNGRVRMLPGRAVRLLSRRPSLELRVLFMCLCTPGSSSGHSPNSVRSFRRRPGTLTWLIHLIPGAIWEPEP